MFSYRLFSFGLLALTLLFPLLALSSCSGDDDDDNDSPPPSDDDSGITGDDTGGDDDTADDDDDTDDDSGGSDDDGAYDCPDIAGDLFEPEVIDIIPGTFTMGSPDDETGHETYETAHEVTLTRRYAMMKYEVTMDLWKAVMGDISGGQWACGEKYPVGAVLWDEAIDFANALSEQYGYDSCYTRENNVVQWDTDCVGFRLPTEAEWEYAARAGTQTAFYGGDIVDGACAETGLDPLAWYCGNSEHATHEVGLKDANDWGLNDMLGNIWEWTWDGFDSDADIPFTPEPATDPAGPGGTAAHAYRGGGIHSSSLDCRSAKRRVAKIDFRDGDTSMRLVRTIHDID
jgi:formylglycine-generating enzyme required for sulfatase activity